MDEMREQALLAKFDELAGEMGSANKAAQRIGIPASTVSQLKKGAYTGNKEAQFNKLEAYFATKDTAADIYDEVRYASTSISERIYQTNKITPVERNNNLSSGNFKEVIITNY